MRRLLWKLPVGAGVIDCALSHQTRSVIAGDVSGDVVIADYDGKELARHSYSMPVWGVDINEAADTFAVGLANKAESKGSFIVVREEVPILEENIRAAVWDVKIINGAADRILASTWGAGLYEYTGSDFPLKQHLEGKNIYGISSTSDGRIFLTVSEEGLYVCDSGQDYRRISRSPVSCYNNVSARGKVIYGSSSNVLSVAMVDTKSEKHYRTALRSPCALEVFRDRLLIGDLEGNFMIAREDTPSIPVFHQRFPGSIWNISADVDSSLIFIACGDGNLYCYDFDLNSVSGQKASTDLESIEWVTSILVGTKVFVSYAHEDEQVVRLLCDSLIAVGCEPWVDFHSLLPGQNWKREIIKAIKHCEFFVLCLSKHSCSKTGFVQKEIREALEMLQMVPDGKIFLIPMRLDDCAIPESLADHHCVSLFAEDGMTKLLKAMCHQKAMT